MSRILIRALLLLAVLVGVAIGAAWYTLRSSLADIDGRVVVAGLETPVSVHRDALGVVTLRGQTREDLARATGFVHAQDRYFQMDLARRKAAGELSVLFGTAALEADRGYRLHRFRHRARAVVEASQPQDRALMAAYTEGVNAGLAALGARPFEYFLLRTAPQPWRVEDSLLVLYSMFLTLNDSLGERDTALDLMYRNLPAGLVDFIVPSGTEWDAPLLGEPLTPVPIPGPEVYDVRGRSSALTAARRVMPIALPGLAGSNNWAVAGTQTKSGAAMIANDMHLPLAVPNVFYRLRIELDGLDDYAVTGVSLAGVPVIVAGSNGRVAWGFTNSYGDWTDVVLLEIDAEDPSRYRTATGWERFTCIDERIDVKGAAAETFEVCETRWGPVIGDDSLGRTRAVRWLAHDEEAVNLGFITLETAGTVAEAIAAANRIGIPPQNIVIADHWGDIGWTIAGRIPRRQGFDPTRPATWTEPGAGWAGWLEPETYPRLVSPPDGRIWTANARVVDGDWLEVLGDGGYALGARAGQIRDGLRARQSLAIEDMLAIQLDDKARFYERWRRLLLETLAAEGASDEPGRAAFRKLLGRGKFRAGTDSVAFRLVYETRARLLNMLFESLTAEVRREAPDFHLEEGLRYGVGRQFEAPAWALLTERPAHLLDPAYVTWDAPVLDAIDATLSSLDEDGPLAERNWGERNRAIIRHPLSGALPRLADWLDMPAEPLPGATHMPRVQRNSFGASERFAVSPGRESEGYFHMPAGQSGHPLSPFYRAGHEAWVEGEPIPFLPGQPQHELLLAPEG